MELFKHLKNFSERIKFNPTKTYLISANIILVVFAIWFSNVGLLPFKNVGDFAFFAALALILGLYRTGWTFVFFVGTLALENINLAPKGLGFSLRPYQFFGFVTMVSLLVQMLSKRLAFSLPKFRWFDSLPIVFAVAGFLGSLGAVNKGESFKLAVIALSFVALYFLTRVYVQSLDDAKRVVPFFLSSGFVVMTYAVWQNVRFLAGKNSFEVMAGRPNATFTEADWLGIYLVFLLSIILTIIFYQSEKTRISNFQFPIFKQFSITKFLNFQNTLSIVSYGLLVMVSTTLILTVSRSAWIGAVIVALGYLKVSLLFNGREDHQQGGFWQGIADMLKREWNWKGFFGALGTLATTLLASIAIIFVFHLTNFQLANRAASTGGLQKITIACESDGLVPQKIKNISELEQYGCRHINLEDIEKEKNAGKIIMEIERPDPNVSLRAEIYQKSIVQIKAHPIFGLGWGGITSVLGTDERGAGLNASNIFLEVWLGSGILGFLSFVILLGYILVFSIGALLGNANKREVVVATVFVMLGWAAVVVPNLFNSGIFLGFVWVYLGVSVSLLAKK